MWRAHLLVYKIHTGSQQLRKCSFLIKVVALHSVNTGGEWILLIAPSCFNATPNTSQMYFLKLSKLQFLQLRKNTINYVTRFPNGYIDQNLKCFQSKNFEGDLEWIFLENEYINSDEIPRPAHKSLYNHLISTIAFFWSTLQMYPIFITVRFFKTKHILSMVWFKKEYADTGKHPFLHHWLNKY